MCVGDIENSREISDHHVKGLNLFAKCGMLRVLYYFAATSLR